ncbi:hypothetical protein TSPI_08792 [Trichinella spiralis]|uniref:Uncharacterized protein n=1 Tax=Trichinella spiralis TaxID=6334 RepID=A0ABR3KTB2_TRISP
MECCYNCRSKDNSMLQTKEDNAASSVCFCLAEQAAADRVELSLDCPFLYPNTILNNIMLRLLETSSLLFSTTVVLLAVCC